MASSPTPVAVRECECCGGNHVIEPDVSTLLADNARLREAGQRVLDGLLARIDNAPKDAVPVFDGIADLHAALTLSKDNGHGG